MDAIVQQVSKLLHKLYHNDELFTNFLLLLASIMI